MSNRVERSVLNGDIKDSLSETDIGDRPLNGELPEKSFHLVSVEIEGDDFWAHPPPNGNREPLVFGKGLPKEVDRDRMFHLDQLPKKELLFWVKRWRVLFLEGVSLGVIDFDRSDMVLVDESPEVMDIQRLFSVDLIHPMEGFQKIVGNRILQTEEKSRNRWIGGMFPGPTFHPLERGERLLDILLEMLNEDNGLPFQQKIESFFGSGDFQKSVDDEDGENDSGEDAQVDG